MGPEYWKPGSPTALKKCSERVSNSCTDETDGCCAVIPCAYCIEWNPETGATVYATADFSTNSWSATIAGAAWLGFWERNAESGECEFVVTLDAAEIYRKSCYEGQSCRDSSDSAGATIDSVSGVITWTKYEPRPLEYIQDEETGCTTHYCDSCECSCECLCVTITEPDTTETKGEICNTAYDCDPPLWEGAVGAFDLSIALGRDEYGRCIITASVDNAEQDPVLFPGCADGAATITLGDGTTIAVSCKKCGCEESTPPDVCNPCPPGTIFPWPVTITFVELGVSADSGNQLDPEEDGETTFLYFVDGDYGPYTIQANFGECEANLSIGFTGGDPVCTFSGATGNGVSMEAVDCPGDTLTLIYTITCENGSTLTVVISG